MPKILVNGVLREMTEQEIVAAQDHVARMEAAEKKRPLTEAEVLRILLASQVNTLPVDDQTALRMMGYYPEWVAGSAVEVGNKCRRGGRLWKARQAHTTQVGMEPENAASLWTRIDETHDGTKYDPIPYEGNMELAKGMYYSQGGVVYLCTRDTGNPVHHTLAELVGLYVETVNEEG
jgi:hypothetical protein